MSEECWECKMNYPLEYWSGYGWFHFNPDGGPDLKCTNPEVINKPNPENDEDQITQRSAAAILRSAGVNGLKEI